MSYSRISSHDRDGYTSVATLGKLFIPSGLWGWDCCASVDCVLCQGLESVQLADHAAQLTFYCLLLVRVTHSSKRVSVENRI